MNDPTATVDWSEISRYVGFWCASAQSNVGGGETGGERAAGVGEPDE